MGQFVDVLVFQCTACGALLKTDAGCTKHEQHCNSATKVDNGQLAIFDCQKDMSTPDSAGEENGLDGTFSR